MTQIKTYMSGALFGLGAPALWHEARDSVNGRRAYDTAFSWQAANAATLPRAHAETGLAAETRLATPNGPRRLDELRPGDTVLDAAGHPATLLHMLRAPAAKTAIRIRAPYFGLDQDLILGARHRIAITSDAAEYLFGARTVLVPVWAIKDTRRAQHWELGKSGALYQLQLDRACALQIGRCAVESLPKSGQDIGKILSENEARCFATEYRHGIHS